MLVQSAGPFADDLLPIDWTVCGVIQAARLACQSFPFRSDKPRQAFVGGIPSPSFAAYVRRRRRIRLRRLGVWGLRAFLSCETSTARRGLGERRVRSGAAPVAPEELRAESAARSLAGEGLAQRRPDHVDQFVIMARRIDEIDRMREFRGVRDPA